MSRGHPLLLSTTTPEHLNQDRENVDKAAQTRPVRTQGTLYFANGMNYFWRMSFRSSWLGGGGGGGQHLAILLVLCRDSVPCSLIVTDSLGLQLLRQGGVMAAG